MQITRVSHHATIETLAVLGLALCERDDDQQKG